MGTHNRPDEQQNVIGVTRGAKSLILTVISGLALLLCSAPSLVAQAAPARVEPGIEYIHHRIGDGPWSIHVLKIERTDGKFRLVSSLAQNTIYGLAAISEQIGALPAQNGRAVAAVNGDFFRIRPGLYQGDPLGLHIVETELVSAPTGPSFWIDRDGLPHIGQVTCKFRATGPDGLDFPFGLNEEGADDAAVLYTPTMGPSTRTSAGLELVLQRDGESDWLPLRAGGCYRARIAGIHRNGDAHLDPNAVVLSIGPERVEKMPNLEAGMVLTLSLETSPDLTGAVTAVAGGPILLSNGNVVPVSSPPRRHPRTVIGWNKDHFVLAVVDGRQEGLSIGMNYPELTSLMKRHGCTYAMNLDGGGSSTLWLGGQVMNSPSDGQERKVANGLIVIAAE